MLSTASNGRASARHCPECAEERIFERPPCADDHGVDCPEWACVDCGFAIVAGFGVEVVAGIPAARSAA